jgi:signal transduction histidine kinase
MHGVWDDGVWSEEDWTTETRPTESGRGFGSADGWPDDAPAAWAARSWPADPAIDDPVASGSLVTGDPAAGDRATHDLLAGQPGFGAPGDADGPAGGRAGQISLPAGALGGVKRRLATLRSDPATLTNTGQIPDYQVPPHAFMLIGRFAVLALVTVLGLLATGSPWIVAFAGLLAIASLPSWAAVPGRSSASGGRAAEIVITCFAAEFVVRNAHPHMFAPPGVAAGAMLPYLVVPPVAAAMQRRRREAAGLLALAAIVLAVLGLVDDQINDRGYLTESIEWLLLAAVAAAATSVLRDLLAQRRDRPQPYAEATRLLTQLRTVARQLPGATLDPGGLAEHLLDDVRTVARSDRAAVMCASGGNRLVVLAQSGATRIDWETSLDADSMISEAWANQLPQTGSTSQARTHPGGDVSVLVVPLAAGVRTVGLLTLECDVAGAYPRDVINRVSALAAPAALRLEAALLFDDVRSLATNEERQRLAREIHDGVAQELVMVGYGIDNTLAVLPDTATDAADELRSLRSEVTRVITELRLSLFELRSEVDRHGGLAAAISEYARTVGASGGLRVHMSLDESTARLPAAVEGELLRIAQEAITNARKHAGATNLWVTCAVDPPFAQVEVSDDGHGMADQRPDGRYGLAIMAERAERIRGRLEVRPREPSGTTVAIVIGTSPRVR